MATATSTLSSSRIDQFMRFGTALDRVNKGIGKEDFAERLQNLFSIVSEINKANDDFLRKHRYLGMTPKAWIRCGWGVACLAGLANLLNFASSILTNIENNKLDCDYPEEVIGTNTGAAASLAVLWIAQTIFSALNEKRETEESDLKKKMHEVHQLQQFFLAYNAFMNPPASDASPDQKIRLDHCLTNLKHLPEEQIPQEAKDRWVQTLIRALPEDSSIRQRLKRQEEIAEQLADHERKLEELQASLKSRNADGALDLPPEEQVKKSSLKKRRLKEKKKTKSAMLALENPPEALSKKSSSGELATDTFLDETNADNASESRPKREKKPLPTKDALRAEFQQNLSELSGDIAYPLNGFWLNKLRFDASGNIKP